MTHLISKATPTNDTDYSCHTKAVHVELVYIINQSLGVHITPLVISSLGGGHTDTYIHFADRINF